MLAVFVLPNDLFYFYFRIVVPASSGHQPHSLTWAGRPGCGQYCPIVTASEALGDGSGRTVEGIASACGRVLLAVAYVALVFALASAARSSLDPGFSAAQRGTLGTDGLVPPPPTTHRDEEPRESVVAYSYLAFGDAAAIRLLLENALAYTEPSSLLIVHVSQHSEVLGDHPDWEWVRRQNATNRVFVNPASIHGVHANSGTILRGHLLNFELAKSISPKLGFFTLMSGDGTLFRAGSEAWIRAAGLSFGLGFSGARRYDLAEKREAVRSRVRRGHVRVSMRNGERTCYGQTIFNRMMKPGDSARLAAAGLWRPNETDSDAKCINFYQHEGTFYPAAMMARFLALLRRTRLWDALLTTEYFAEEVWLPNYVLIHEREALLNLDFSPPLVTRFLSNENQECCTWDWGVLQRLFTGANWTDSRSNAHTATFGIKFQWPKSPPEVAMLEDLWCKGSGECDLRRRRNPQGQPWLALYGMQRRGIRRDPSIGPLQQLAKLNGVPWPSEAAGLGSSSTRSSSSSSSVAREARIDEGNTQ